MAVQEIKVPDIGDFSNVPVIEILVAAGDSVAVDDPLITLESDKATMRSHPRMLVSSRSCGSRLAIRLAKAR